MKGPTRLREEGDSAPGRLRELFQHARPTRGMTPDEAAATTKLIAQIAATPVAIVPFYLTKKFLSWFLGVGGTAGVVAAAVLMLRPSDEMVVPAKPILTMPAASTPAPEQLVAPDKPRAPEVGPSPVVVERSERPANVDAPVRKSVPRQTGTPLDKSPSTAIPSTTPPPIDPLERENQLIDSAQQLVVTDPTKALSILEEHKQQFPTGQLAPEREVAAIEALVQLGRVDEARARADELLKAPGGNAYRGRVRQLLNGKR